jgi:transposase
MSKTRFKKKKGKKAEPQRRELPLEELCAIVERAKAGPLCEGDYETLKAAMETLAFLTQELEAKGTTLARLRKLIFGASTEKTSQVLGDDKPGGDPPGEEKGPGAAAGEASGGESKGATQNEKPKPKGHGRNGASAFRGAQKVKVAHEVLKRGDPCPACQKGKVYPTGTSAWRGVARSDQPNQLMARQVGARRRRSAFGRCAAGHGG